MSSSPETPQDDALLAALRAAAPQPPAGLAERVLAGVREAALAKIRFRQELEQSARGILVAAAAGLLICGALVLGGSPEDGRVTADGRPSRAPSASQAPAAPRAGVAPLTSNVDDAQVLSLATPPGVLEGELTDGLWLFNGEEDE